MIYFITGPMFSGKSKRLIELPINSYNENIEKVWIKHSSDSRFEEDYIVSRAGPKIRCKTANTSIDIINILASFSDYVKVICIDEIQFFEEDVVDTLERISCSGVDIYVAGLSLDFRGDSFPTSSNLLARADKVEVLCADSCYACSNLGASRTVRKSDFYGTTSMSEGDNIVIGSDEYCATCLECFRLIKGI